jgi:hypothetical protein
MEAAHRPQRRGCDLRPLRPGKRDERDRHGQHKHWIAPGGIVLRQPDDRAADPGHRRDELSPGQHRRAHDDSDAGDDDNPPTTEREQRWDGVGLGKGRHAAAADEREPEECRVRIAGHPALHRRRKQKPPRRQTKTPDDECHRDQAGDRPEPCGSELAEREQGQVQEKRRRPTSEPDLSPGRHPRIGAANPAYGRRVVDASIAEQLAAV